MIQTPLQPRFKLSIKFQKLNVFLQHPEDRSKGRLVKNYEGSEALLYMPANKLVYHNIIDAGKRQETLRSETKDLLLTA